MQLGGSRLHQLYILFTYVVLTNFVVSELGKLKGSCVVNGHSHPGVSFAFYGDGADVIFAIEEISIKTLILFYK